MENSKTKKTLEELIKEYEKEAISNPFNTKGERCHFTGVPINGDDYIIYNHSETRRYKVLPHFKDERLKPEVTLCDGELYNNHKFDIVKARDTGKRDLRKNLYKTDTGSYVENIDEHVYYERGDYYIDPRNVVTAKDTGRQVSSRMSYHSDMGDYYEFRELSGDFNHPFYYNYTHYNKEDPARCIGVEFELGDSNKLQREMLLDDELRRHFQTVRDGSLDGIRQGCEFVSVPLRLDEVQPLVTRFLNLAKKTGATVHDSCGFHVHISGRNLSFFDLGSLIAVCKNNENDILQRFPLTRKGNRYCKMLTERFNGFINAKTPDEKNQAGMQLYQDNNANFERRHENGKYIDGRNQRGIRYYWLNIDRMFQMRKTPEQKTVEFRLHEATFDIERFVGFIYLCFYIVYFSKKHGKETAMSSSLTDVQNFANYSHRKFIQNFFDSSEKFIKQHEKKDKDEKKNVGDFYIAMDNIQMDDNFNANF